MAYRCTDADEADGGGGRGVGWENLRRWRVEKPSLGNVINFAITPSIEVYDSTTDRWVHKAPLPVGLHHVGIGVAGGRLYIIGGYTKSGFTVWSPVATVYAYDPTMESWTERAPMPTARGALSVTEHEGRLYAIGGYDGKANSSAVEVYDPIRNVWTAAAVLPTPRDHLATETVGGKIYAIGGRVNGDYSRNLAITESTIQLLIVGRTSRIYQLRVAA